MEVGLENLGNTCFMNSSLQCLLHIEPLVSYFLATDIDKVLNKKSPMKGLIASSFAQLVREISDAAAGSAIAPVNFQKVVGRHAPHLLDNQQQDCQEFLRFLLDGMSEDLCRRQQSAVGNMGSSTSNRNADVDAAAGGEEGEGAKARTTAAGAEAPTVAAGAVAPTAVGGAVPEAATSGTGTAAGTAAGAPHSDAPSTTHPQPPLTKSPNKHALGTPSRGRSNRSPTLSPDASHTTPHTTPHPVSHTTPHTTSHTTPHTTPHPVSHTTPHTTSHTTPHTTPHPVSHTTPHTTPLAASHTTPHPISHTTPHTTPHAAAHTAAHLASHTASLPQINHDEHHDERHDKRHDERHGERHNERHDERHDDHEDGLDSSQRGTDVAAAKASHAQRLRDQVAQSKPAIVQLTIENEGGDGSNSTTKRGNFPHPQRVRRPSRPGHAPLRLESSTFEDNDLHVEGSPIPLLSSSMKSISNTDMHAKEGLMSEVDGSSFRSAKAPNTAPMPDLYNGSKANKGAGIGRMQQSPRTLSPRNSVLSTPVIGEDKGGDKGGDKSGDRSGDSTAITTTGGATSSTTTPRMRSLFPSINPTFNFRNMTIGSGNTSRLQTPSAKGDRASGPESDDPWIRPKTEGTGSILNPEQLEQSRAAALQQSRKAWDGYLALNDSVVTDIFAGQLQSTIECLTCHHRSFCFDPFLDLSVPIPKGPEVTQQLKSSWRRSTPSQTTEPLKCPLEECIARFTGEEILDGENMYTCEKCKEKRKCIKKLSIFKYPRILVIHIMRFRYSELSREKLSTDIIFPIHGLDLSPFLSTDKSVTAATNATATTTTTATATATTGAKGGAQSPTILPFPPSLSTKPSSQSKFQSLLSKGSAKVAVVATDSVGEGAVSGQKEGASSGRTIGGVSGGVSGVSGVSGGVGGVASGKVDADVDDRELYESAPSTPTTKTADPGSSSSALKSPPPLVQPDATTLRVSSGKDDSTPGGSGPTSSKTTTPAEFDADALPPVYDLIGVSNHCGTLNGGHYIAHVDTHASVVGGNWSTAVGGPRGRNRPAERQRNQEGEEVDAPGDREEQGGESRWVCFNDEHVSLASKSNLVGPSAYVLFYRLKE